jgi:hypothetical protein
VLTGEQSWRAVGWSKSEQNEVARKRNVKGFLRSASCCF